MKCSTRIVVVMTAMTALFVARDALAQQASTGSGTGPQISARSQQAGFAYVPPSSQPRPGLFAHTNYVLRTVTGGKPAGVLAPSADAFGGKLSTLAPPSDGAGPNITLTQMAETPASMGCIYVQSPVHAGCVPNYASGSGGPSSAGYGAIAIVDAYHNPTAASDLATFDAYWGIPAPPSFTVLYGSPTCSPPPPDQGWAVEESLDIEWAHVFAPKAAIILVEACSNSYADLFAAEQVAFNYIKNNFPAGGQVTNSWQGGEYSGQIADDSKFSDRGYPPYYGNNVHILAFASSGDGGFEGATTGYPSGNPWVVSAGGTSVMRNAANNYFYAEYCWGGSGGGTSTYETYTTTFSGGNVGPWADFQYPLFGQSNRATPDMSFNADPASGVWVYSQYGGGGWIVVGGTSVSSPALAGIVNRAGNKLGSYRINAINNNSFFNAEENHLLYSQLYSALAYAKNFYDVKVGSNGTTAVAGWDYCTGIGSPRGLLGK
jgi:subtilase family serine protease